LVSNGHSEKYSSRLEEESVQNAMWERFAARLTGFVELQYWWRYAGLSSSASEAYQKVGSYSLVGFFSPALGCPTLCGTCEPASSWILLSSATLARWCAGLIDILCAIERQLLFLEQARESSWLLGETMWVGGENCWMRMLHNDFKEDAARRLEELAATDGNTSGRYQTKHDDNGLLLRIRAAFSTKHVVFTTSLVLPHASLLPATRGLTSHLPLLYT
jgi:hypothetical protein